MRWRRDGGDYYIGDVSGKEPPKPGGMVWWIIHGKFEANAWTENKSIEFKRKFKSVRTAKNAVERWLGVKKCKKQ